MLATAATLSLSLVVSGVVAASNASHWDRYGAIKKGVEWSSCEDAPGSNLRCGTFDVPLDYHNSTAGKATIALAKFPATNNPRLGTLFVNPGGPGGSGVDFVIGRGSQIHNITGGQYDVVGFDPRGVGATWPRIDCFNSTKEEAIFWEGTIPYAGIETHGNFTNPDQTDSDVKYFWAQETEVDKLLKKVGERCLQRNGDALRYVGTAAVVRDMVALSDVLDGEGAYIHYWGFSYGTIIGSYLVNMFPNRIGRVAIDGVVNPELWAQEPSYKAWSYKIQNTDDVFEGFLQSCATAGPGNCAIAERGSTAQSIRDWVMALMDKADESYQKGETFGSAALRNQIFQAMYTPLSWTGLAEDLYQEADSLYNPNGHQAGRRRRRSIGNGLPDSIFGIPRRSVRSRSGPSHPSLKKREVSETLYDYAFEAITCADAIDMPTTTTKDIFNEIVDASARVSMMFGPSFGDGGFYCHHWPARAPERFTGPWNTKTKTPILVIGNKADPITPLAGAKFVADTLGDSAYLVEQDDFGHTSLAEHSDCTTSILKNFFSNGKYPKDDEFCGTNQQLFPNKGITKQSLAAAPSSPMLDPGVPVPGSKSSTPKNLAAAGEGSASASAATVTVTAPADANASKELEEQLKHEQEKARNLEIALGALGVALAAAILSAVFLAVSARRRNQQNKFASSSAAFPKIFRKGSRNTPAMVSHDMDGNEDAFLPPMKDAEKVFDARDGSSHAYEQASGRDSMDTLRGYSDPYDPHVSAPAASAAPSSSNGLHSPPRGLGHSREPSAETVRSNSPRPYRD